MNVCRGGQRNAEQSRRCKTEVPGKYVNVRRRITYLKQSLDQGTQWVVFEPNREPLWPSS